MLYAYPMDRTGCGFYRVIWPLSEISDRVAITLVNPGDDGGLKANLDTRRVAVGIEAPSDCTAVLLQRPTNELLVSLIPFLKEAGVSVLVDVDDDLHALSPRHPASTELAGPKRQPGHSRDALMHACKQADLVICSTPALLERYAPGPGGRGVVLRNRLRSDFESCLQGGVPGGTLTPPPHRASRRPDSDIRVGWPGVIMTHPDDLSVLNRALPRLVTEFTVVGPQPDDPARARRLLGVPTTFTGSVTFADWFSSINSHLDIGVAPLQPSAFNNSKSWLKPLELAASLVPCVVSDTPEYRELGIGLLARPDTHKSWRHHLQRFIDSPALRAEEVERNLSLARANTYAKHADEWLAALTPYTETLTVIRTDTDQEALCAQQRSSPVTAGSSALP